MNNSSRHFNELSLTGRFSNQNTNFCTLQKRLAAVFSLVFLTVAFSITALAQVTVSPANLQGWSKADTRPGGTVNLITDGTTPAGTGALQLITDNTNAAKAQFLHAENTPLASVTTLSYNTKQVSSSFVDGVPSYQVAVFLDGTSGTFTNFVYEPYNNGQTITPNTWQQWDVFAGQVWSSRTVNAGGACMVTAGAGGPPFYTFAQLTANCPNAIVVGFGVNVGTFNPSYNTEVDLVNFNGTTYDFEPSAAVSLTPAGSPTSTDNDYTRINNAVQFISPGGTIMLNGIFNWTETNAAASWALGSDGQTGTPTLANDDYSILVPPGLTGVTFTAANLGAATIQGPGDLAGVNLEGVLVFDGGPNQNWTVSNIRFVDFDLSIGMFNGAGGTTAYNGTKIQNNYILTARDLNATVAPVDVNQNIGIHYSFGTNQMISGNTIEIHGDGVSDTANSFFSTEVGMQSNTSGGAVYEGLQITNNIVRVLNAQSANPQIVLGIWENGHAHTSNITVSGNQFLNMAVGNNPTVNIERGFRITSHSSANTTVNYINNRVEGANIGFQFLPTSANTGQVQIKSNLILNNATGVLTNTNGMANLSFNRIVGNSIAGVDNSLGLTVIAENNWWGCNFGPGAGGAGCSGTANGILGVVDADPWLVLTTSASPNAIATGETSNISSQITFNSNGVDTSSSGTIPDNTPASFTGTLGTVVPTTGATTAGVTGTVFTAGAAAGNGSGNTTIDGQTVNAPITIAFSCNTITVPATTNVNSNTQFLVPVSVDDTTGRGILSYDFTLNYNPAVITPIAVETAGTLSAGWSITTNNSSGTLVVSGFNTSALTGSGVLLNVRFIATGGIGTTSPVAIPSFQFNEGIPCVNPITAGVVNIISGTVGGRVTYVNAPSGTVPVPNTTLNAAGSTPLTTTTNSMGFYTLSGFGAGAYTVTPSKSNQVNGISNADSSAIAQQVVGFITLNTTQRIAADVSGNGSITSLDAAYIAQFIALIPNPGFTGSWRFLPANRSYPNVLTNSVNQDYSAILLGEVTGNWNPSGPLSPSLLGESEQSESKSKPRVTVTAIVPQTIASGANFTVDLTAYNPTSEDIRGYQFELLYDANVITASSVAPCDNAGTISNELSVVCNSGTPGILRVVLFGASPIDKSGGLLKLNFTAIGKPGAKSPLTFQGFMFNEDLSADITVDKPIGIADTGRTRK